MKPFKKLVAAAGTKMYSGYVYNDSSLNVYFWAVEQFMIRISNTLIKKCCKDAYKLKFLRSTVSYTTYWMD